MRWLPREGRFQGPLLRGDISGKTKSLESRGSAGRAGCRQCFDGGGRHEIFKGPDSITDDNRDSPFFIRRPLKRPECRSGPVRNCRPSANPARSKVQLLTRKAIRHWHNSLESCGLSARDVFTYRPASLLKTYAPAQPVEAEITYIPCPVLNRAFKSSLLKNRLILALTRHFLKRGVHGRNDLASSGQLCREIEMCAFIFTVGPFASWLP
nr:uncharacterized protein LOC112547470 [Pelodiscus sinensis]|eukprot:XP_025045510.1 uncharacterized protein LOC112547470 [Pelodiscus sinensis]